MAPPLAIMPEVVEPESAAAVSPVIPYCFMIDANEVRIGAILIQSVVAVYIREKFIICCCGCRTNDINTSKVKSIV